MNDAEVFARRRQKAIKVCAQLPLTSVNGLAETIAIAVAWQTDQEGRFIGAGIDPDLAIHIARFILEVKAKQGTKQEPVGYADKYDLERKGHDFWVSRQEGKHTVPLYAKQYKQDHGFDRTASHMAGEYVDTESSNDFVPDWDTLQPYIDRIAELELKIVMLDEACANCGVKTTDGYALYCVKCSEPLREWLDLTDEEISEAVGNRSLNETYLRYFRKVLAKIKEKNT